MKHPLAASLVVVALACGAAAMAADAHDGMNMQGHGAMTTAEGVGVVKAVDAKAGTATLQHGRIPALNWPAMTMTFKATPPTILQGVKVGQTVSFTLMQMGGDTTLTAIKPK